MVTSPLGDYLRSRRAHLEPADVGLPRGGVRRVAGLRREEVAMLADMSSDYLTRLEQGREHTPSAQMLESLGRALALDEDGRTHLFRLAGLTPRAAAGRREETVDPDLQRLLDNWPDNPAIVLGRAYDVLAANVLGEVLFSRFESSRNLLEKVFTDPASRSFYADWEKAAAGTVAGFRLLEGAAPHNPRINEVVDGLLVASPEFAAMWRENEARGKGSEVKEFVHPEVGPLTLRMQTFDVRSAPGQQLVVYLAEPGSETARALSLLGTLAATAEDALQESHGV